MPFLKSFDYNLPKELIAQKPVRPRDNSRLLVVDAEKNRLEHKIFHEIGDFLKAGDVVVLNNSKVFPARLSGKKETGGKVEIFLLKDKGNSLYEVLLKNVKQKEGNKKILIGKNFYCETVESFDRGRWLVKFNKKGKSLLKSIYEFGSTPTPPYVTMPSNLREYQTVYAKNVGSVAAPTAGFHFTNRLINKLKKRGVQFEELTLHVGWGTFEPVREGKVEDHKMHSEWASLSGEAARRINKAKKEGRRVIAVGTTATRVLESFADKKDHLRAGTKDVDLFVYPPYKFKIIDGMVTNFHLPKSSLVILISAFLCFKNKKWKTSKAVEVYKEAVKKKYRFYSFGDAMLIV